MAKTSAQLIRDAKWALGFQGQEWLRNVPGNNRSGWSNRREAELVQLGVLLPHPTNPDRWVVGSPELPAEFN